MKKLYSKLKHTLLLLYFNLNSRVSLYCFACLFKSVFIFSLEKLKTLECYWLPDYDHPNIVNKYVIFGLTYKH